MKKLIISAVVAMVAFNASAESDTSNICERIHSLSAKIMSHRQDGAPMTELMAIADSNKEGKAYKLITTIIIDAYTKPRYSTEAHKKIAVDDFANEVALGCYQSIGEEK